MNRLQRVQRSLLSDEVEVGDQPGIRIYDGENRTFLEKGVLILTSLRLLWRDQQHPNPNYEIALNLSMIVLAEELAGGWNKSDKIVLYLERCTENTPNQVASYSSSDHIKLSFREGGQSVFYRRLSEVLAKKSWLPGRSVNTAGPKFRPGISGIERQIQAKAEQTNKNISVAFEDLRTLMDMARDMVGLSKNISQRIRDKQGEISEDETVVFKSQMLSLGISDPVTKDSFSTNVSYHQELAKQLSQSLEGVVKDAGGYLSLTDVYCRVNRARGLELLSPEDLVNGCKMLESLKLPIQLQVFESGLKVVRLAAHDGHQAAVEIQKLVDENGSLSANELSPLIKCTVILAKERLLSAERLGMLCRDDTLEGLRFYPNRFISEDETD